MHTDYLDGERIFLIRDFLTPDECASFMTDSERAGYEDAPITTSSGFVMAKDIRNNARVILDDPALAARWFRRARPCLPRNVGEWQVVGLNERFRFYRYDPGQKFAPHYDGPFQRSNGELSQLTLMVYLNANFRGGETRFYDDDRELRVTVRPEIGMALGFVHNQLHEGAAIVSGRKYVLRTDVMCALLE